MIDPTYLDQLVSLRAAQGSAGKVRLLSSGNCGETKNLQMIGRVHRVHNRFWESVLSFPFPSTFPKPPENGNGNGNVYEEGIASFVIHDHLYL